MSIQYLWTFLALRMAQVADPDISKTLAGKTFAESSLKILTLYAKSHIESIFFNLKRQADLLLIIFRNID